MSSPLRTLTDATASTPPMPVLFLGHGSPMNAIEENQFVAGFREVARQLPPPAAILCVSAHWETPGTRVTAMEQPRTIHDFGGFAPELFQVQYPAPGSPALAQLTKELALKTHIAYDHHWGLDHGAWSVIKHLYPEANVPVVQLSLNRHAGPAEHYALGQELAALRRKGVLVVGSGNMVHNLGQVAWDRLNEPSFGFDWALEARQQMNQWLLEGNHEALTHFARQGKAWQLAIPTPEHYLPLLYTLGMQLPTDELALFNDVAVGGSLTMTSVWLKPAV